MSSIGTLYFWYQFDFFNSLGYELTQDLYANPKNWRGVGRATADRMATLKGRYGNDPKFLDSDQRALLFNALFDAEFTATIQQLMASASSLAQRQVDSGLPALRRSFRSTAGMLKDLMVPLEQSIAVKMCNDDVTKLVDEIRDILKDPNVSRMFGRSAFPKDYPYDPDLDASELISEISKRVGSRSYTTAEVMNKQRVASLGREVINDVLGFDVDHATEPATDQLSEKVYSWLTSAGMPGVVQATTGPVAVPPPPAALVSFAPKRA
jgi:hypothetical protein